MVHARLIVLRGEDCVAFAIGHLIVLFEVQKLPAHQGVVVGVDIGCNEGSSPIGLNKENDY